MTAISQHPAGLSAYPRIAYFGALLGVSTLLIAKAERYLAADGTDDGGRTPVVRVTTSPVLAASRSDVMSTRMVSAVVDREMRDLHRLDPSLYELVLGESHGLIVRSRGLDGEAHFIGESFREYDELVAAATVSRDAAVSRLALVTRIAISSNGVRIQGTATNRSANGVPVEWVYDCLLPYEWVEQYAPNLIR